MKNNKTRNSNYATSKKMLLFILVIGTLFTVSSLKAQSKIKIGYSEWPGWAAWEIAIKKGWFKNVGLDVEFKWMEYSESLDAYMNGNLDAVCMTNYDAIVVGAKGAKSRAILVNDYSNGSDMIIGSSKIKSIKELKGKTIGVETGLVDHQLLLTALTVHKMKESDVSIVNITTDATPTALLEGKVDAIAAWQPYSGVALKIVPGSKVLFSSRDAKGLIYDMLCVNDQSLTKNKKDWEKITDIWFKIVDFLKTNREDAIKIISKRIGISPSDLDKDLAGVYLLDKKANKKVFKKASGLLSVYGSTIIADKFNIKNKIYNIPQSVEEYIYPNIIQ